MKRFYRIALLAMACAGASACTSHLDSNASSQPDEESSIRDSVTVAEQCQMATSIEVGHMVNGKQVTDRLRLTDDAGMDAAISLRAFQVAANYFGTANIISSRLINQVECFPQAPASPTAKGISTARSKITKLDDPTGNSLCVDSNDVASCSPTPPSHTYDYPSTDSCTVTNYTQATSFSCTDSNAIVTKNGDVVLAINTQQLRDDIAAKTQALRRLVGDANVVTNFHFDIVINPDQRAAIVSNEAFGNIAQAIKTASDRGGPLPDVPQILANLPQAPTNIDFYTQLMNAYQTKIDRLNLLAQITNGALLSPQQVNAFYQNFVGQSRLIDQLDVNHSVSSLNQATTVINNVIGQLANTDPASTIYNQVKAGAQSLLQAHTSQGVFAPGQTLDFVVPNLYQSLTDADIDKQLISSEMLIELNQQLLKSDGMTRATAMAGSLGLLGDSLANNDMDRSLRLYDRVLATEFFFDNTDPAGTSYDVHLTPDAQALYNIQAQPNSAISYEVINLLNETADYNAATRKFTVDVTAVISLNAREALSTNDLQRALYHTEEAYGVLDFLKTGGLAYLNDALAKVGSTAEGIGDTVSRLWSDPEALGDHFKAALANWQQTLDIILQQPLDVINRWPGLTDEARVALIGAIAAGVLATIPTEVVEAGGLTEALTEAVKLHLDRAAEALSFVEQGGSTLPENAAVELMKDLEAYEITTTEEAIQAAKGLDEEMPCTLFGGGGVVSDLVRPAAQKQPCNLHQISEEFRKLKIEAAQMGFTSEQDLKDIMKSKEAFPGGQVIPNNMSGKEEAFAKQIVQDHDGGLFVGNQDETRKAIDGFYQGFPAQLKTITSTSDLKWKSLVGAVKEAEISAIKAKVSKVRVFVQGNTLTGSDVLRALEESGLGQYTTKGIISSIEIFVEGQWETIVNGALQ